MAEERNRRSVVALVAITVFFGVLTPSFVNCLYPYDILANLIRCSRFLFQETVSSQKREILLQ